MTVSCAFCNGTGVQPHSIKMACLSCHGKGKVEFERDAIACSACKGSGRISGFSVLSCMECRGVGMIEKIQEERGKLSRAVAWFKIIINKIWNIIKGILRKIVKGLSVFVDWMKIQLNREILWYKAIINIIKRH